LRSKELLNEKDQSLKQWDRNMAGLLARIYQKLIDDCQDDLQITCDAEVQVFHIGSLRIVGIPGELFMRLGRQIMDYRCDGLTMIACYANDFLGYFPTSEAYGDKDYEYPTDIVPLILGMFPFQQNVGNILVRAAKYLIQK